MLAPSLSRAVHRDALPSLRVLALLLFGPAAAAGEPQILSVFPIGGQQGTTYRAAIRGHSLDGAYALWFASPTFEAKVLTLEEDPDQPEPKKRADGDPKPDLIQRLEGRSVVSHRSPRRADRGTPGHRR